MKHIIPTDLIFHTIGFKRNLAQVLGKRTTKMLKKCRKLCDILIKRDVSGLTDFKNKYHEYMRLKEDLMERGFYELLPQLSILYPIKQQKFQHKKIEIKKKEEVSTEELLRENNILLNKLRTMDFKDIRKNHPYFKKYMLVLYELKYRGIQHFDRLRYSPRQRERIIQFLGGKCAECGTQRRLTLHHVVPKSKAGTDDIVNLRCLCRECHDVVHGNNRVNPVKVNIFKKAGLQVEA